MQFDPFAPSIVSYAIYLLSTCVALYNRYWYHKLYINVLRVSSKIAVRGLLLSFSIPYHALYRLHVQMYAHRLAMQAIDVPRATVVISLCDLDIYHYCLLAAVTLLIARPILVAFCRRSANTNFPTGKCFTIFFLIRRSS